MLSFALPFSVPLPVPLLRCFAGITYAVRYVLRVAYMAFVARMRSRLPACSLGAGCRMPAACLSALRGGAPLAVVFRSCRAVRFPRRRALGSIPNRRDAIRYCIENAQEHDIVVLAGKGHEDYQEIKGVKRHFDEREIVADILKELGMEE